MTPRSLRGSESRSVRRPLPGEGLDLTSALQASRSIATREGGFGELPQGAAAIWMNSPMGADLEGMRELERSDAELLERIVAGDEQAFVGLYHRWRRALFRFALAMTGCAAIADDVVQE